MKQWNVGVIEPAGSSEMSVHGVAFREFVWSRLRECEGGKEKPGARNDNRLAASVPGNLVDSTVLFVQVNRSWRNMYFRKFVLLREGLNTFVSINHLKPCGHYTYQQFNIQQFYVLSTQSMCFVWIWEQTAIISLHSINWLVFITETECLLRGTDWIALSL
jgi:hypothetical protein